MVMPGLTTTSRYSNHYIDIFVLQDGRIKLYIQYFNPLNTMKALGVKIPEWSLPNFSGTVPEE